MKGYKGFDKDLKCKDLQYEVGKEAAVDGDIELCKRGLHFCENPHDVFLYYPPNINNRFAVVEADDVSNERNGADSKRVSRRLIVKKELSVFDICKIAVSTFFENFEFYKKIKDSCLKNNRLRDYGIDRGDNYDVVSAGTYGIAQAGINSAAYVSDYGIAQAGYKGVCKGENNSIAQSGDHGIAQAGCHGIAKVGFQGAASAGDSGIAKSGNNSVAEAENWGIARVGDDGVAVAGYYGIAYCGCGGASNAGDCGVAISNRFGIAQAGLCGVAITQDNGCVKGDYGCILVARDVRFSIETRRYEVTDWACAIVDGKDIKPDTWYRLRDGKLVEVEKFADNHAVE